MENPRDTAYHLLSRGERHRPPSEEEVSPLAAEIGYGALRHRSRLDWIIEKATGKRKHSLSTEVLNILRMGVYQILFVSSVPAYAAVSESVNLAGRHAPKAKGFVNWALRRIDSSYADRPGASEITDPVQWLATFHSFPLWMVRRWHTRFGEAETARLLEAMNIFPPLDLRVNALRCSPERAAAKLREEGGDVTPGAWAPSAIHLGGLRRVTQLPLFREGKIYIQDQSSQLAALALAPRPGERVLDACAGVGGKTSHLAELTGDRGEIAAVEPDGGRLKLLRENLERLGIVSVTAVREDLLSSSFSPSGFFDRILVDVPCTGLGIIRRHPELKWEKRAADVPRLADLQLRLLRRAAVMLAPGGTLAYSTCTIEPEENGEVVRRFLGEQSGYHSVPPGGGAIRNVEKLLDTEGHLAVYPHRHGMNGGFVALLRREDPA